MNTGEDLTNVVARISAEMAEEGVKFTGKIAKELLLLVLEKTKESNKYRSGLVGIKKLLKSDEELKSAKINKVHMEEFTKQAKKMGIAFASIRDTEGEQYRIVFKGSNTELVKGIWEDIIKQTKEKIEQEKRLNSVIEKIEKVIDIDDINEEQKAKCEVALQLDKAKAIKKILNKEGIENDLVIKKLEGNLEGETKKLKAIIQYKVTKEDLEKTRQIVEEFKDKTIEELERFINKDNLKIENISEMEETVKKDDSKNELIPVPGKDEQKEKVSVRQKLNNIKSDREEKKQVKDQRTKIKSTKSKEIEK